MVYQKINFIFVTGIIYYSANMSRILKISFVLLSLFLSIGKMGYGQNTHLKFEHLTVNDGLPQNSVYSITKDKYGFIWFGTWGGAVRYDGYHVKVFRANENDSTALSDNRVSAIVTDSLNNIWIEVEPRDYLFLYNYEKENFHRIPRDNTPSYILDKINIQYRYSVKRASNDTYEWFTSSNGLLQINRQTGDSVLYQADQNDPSSLSDNITKYIYLDDQQHFWVGTQSGGVNHADLNTKPFVNYHKGSEGKGLVDNVVRAMTVDHQGRIWVGSENHGITIIDPSKKENKYTYIGSKFLNDLMIRNLFCDSQGLVWIGTKKGLVYYDPAKDEFKNCSLNMCHPSVFAIAEDQQGAIWVGTYNGLALYDRNLDEFHCINKASGLAGNQIMDLLVDQENNLWVATEEGGLSKLSPPPNFIGKKEFTITNYTENIGQENGILSNRIYSLAEDKTGNIWAATDAGLSQLSPRNNRFQNFTKQNGLPDDFTTALAADAQGSIWVSHTKGLTKVNAETGAMQSFNMQDGLQGNEFKQNAAFQHAPSGMLFFGGSNGLTSFQPSQIKANPYPPKVVLTQLDVMHQDVQIGNKVNDRIILENALLATEEITLTWWDKTFMLEFTALHYANPRSNKYKYMLEGYDADWIFTDASRPTASYANLPAGDYTFKVHGANSDGLWNETATTLKIKILPPWWLSWWAMLIYFMLFCTLAWLVYRYLNSKIQLRKKEAIHQAKLHFFTEVSHEFRTPLTLIIDPLERLIAEKPQQKVAEQYYQLMHRNAQQLLALVNQLLDFRKLESGHLQLDLENSDLVAFVRSLAASFEEMAKQRQISFKVTTNSTPLIIPFDHAKLTMVLNNLLSNAFKFTPNQGKITLDLKETSQPKKGVIIQVKDTGQGISKEELEKVFGIFYQASNNKGQYKGSGIGLSLTKELIALHGGKIMVDSELGKGSCFSVFLPDNTTSSETSRTVITNTEPLSFEDKGDEKKKPVSHNNDPDRAVILVVDDNDDIRTYVEMNFDQEYQVLTANNGLEGLASATNHIPDLIISDVMMPDMNGLEMCEKLKTDERTSHIPIILLTARQSAAAKTEGYETGADAYVTKPFDTSVLRAQVHNLLEQRKRLRELFSNGSAKDLKKIAVNATDVAFLEKTRQLIESNLESENLDIDSLAEQLNMSRSQFYRKIKALTNKSASDFVTSFRMNQAAEFLLSGQYNISETAYKVGYSIPNNFTRAFAKHFGSSPSQFIKEKTENN